MAELNATAGSVLGFLLDGPRTGWELINELGAQVGPFWNVTRSQVYRELKALAEVGYVEAGEVGARDRKPYTITPEGVAAFGEWLALDPGPDIIRVPLLLKMYFGDRLDASTLTRFVSEQRGYRERSLAEFSSLADAFAADPSPVGHVVRFGVMFEEMVLAWLDTLPWG